MGIIKKWNIDKIYFYPYGGCTKFNTIINVSLCDELLILIAGPLTQIIFYFIVRNFFSYSNLILLSRYNYLILAFNLLPIYPLDGGRLINIFLRTIIPYKKSLKISFYLSFIIILFLLIYKKTVVFLIIIFFILYKSYEEKRKIKEYFNKFLLERCLYSFNFKKTKTVNCVNNFYFHKRHIIKENNGYITEKNYLKRYFNV